MDFVIASSSEWLYPDRTPEWYRRAERTGASAASVRLRSARNSFAAFQVMLAGLPASGARLTASVSCEAGVNGEAGASCEAGVAVEVFRERSVNVGLNTGVHGFTAGWDVAKDYATREAPFRVYDALEPVGADGVSVEAETEAVYVCVNVPAEARTGVHALTLTLDVSGCGSVTVSITLDAAAVVVPDESLYVTNWYTVGGMASAHKVRPWSEEHWDIVRGYGRQMRRMHQNVFWITWDLVVASSDGGGGWRFDFNRAKRLIEEYLGLGFTVIEGSPVFGRDDWSANEFKINTPEGRVGALTPEGCAYTAALLNAWRAFLLENGWYDKLIQHVGDEPHGGCAAEYRILAGIVRRYLPGVKLIDAVETHELYGALDIMVPKNDYYERNAAVIENLRARGDEIWFYTCCIPGGKYCNRFLDMPLIRSRMLHWGNYKYSIPGFLHWGLNHWRGDPYEDTTPLNGPTNRLPAGDTNIVYPLGAGAIPSMRGEQMRAGAEDFELLRALAERDRAAADAICARVFRAFDDADNTPDCFDDAHDALLDALSKQQYI